MTGCQFLKGLVDPGRRAVNESIELFAFAGDLFCDLLQTLRARQVCAAEVDGEVFLSGDIF
jgi:hypothetical protein